MRLDELERAAVGAAGRWGGGRRVSRRIPREGVRATSDLERARLDAACRWSAGRRMISPITIDELTRAAGEAERAWLQAEREEGHA